MPNRRRPSKARIAQARARFDAGDPLGAIAQTLDVTPATFARWRREWEWPSRDARAALAAIPETTAPATAPVGDGVTPTDVELFDTPRLIRCLRQALQAEITAIAACGGDRRTAEPRSRVLGNIARTLAVLRDLETQIGRDSKDTGDSDDADQPPVDLAELRRELARRLHRLGAERDDP